MKKVSILIPAYNEEEVLYTLYDRLENVINKLKEQTKKTKTIKK